MSSYIASSARLSIAPHRILAVSLGPPNAHPDRELFDNPSDDSANLAKPEASVSGARHHELISAEARGQVDAPDTPSNARPDLTQDSVAGGVALSVVALLEAVEVDDENPELSLIAGRSLPLHREAMVKRPAGW